MLKKSKLPIGLDISDLSLKAIQFNKKGNNLSIAAVGKYNLKPGIVENGDIIDVEKFLSAMHEMLSKTLYGSFSGSDVVACLPNVDTFIKLVEIEKSANTLPIQISLELEKNFPFNKNEVYFDWQTIEKKTETSLVLIAAAPKNIVDRYIEILKKTKLEILALEAEPVAIARCLLEEERPQKSATKEKNYCLIDIGAKRTSLTIYSKNTIVSSISLPISGNETTKLISSSLEISEAEAEKAKIICGLDKSQAHGIVAGILSEMTDTLISKIEQAVNFFYKHYPDRGEINKIILCGGGSNIKFIDKTINEYIKIETIIGNPLVNLGANDADYQKIFIEKHKIDTTSLKKFDDNFLTMKQNSITNYTTAIGLALRNHFITKI